MTYMKNSKTKVNKKNFYSTASKYLNSQKLIDSNEYDALQS